MPLLPSSTTVTAAGDAPAGRLWRLLAQPACWPAWAPHMAHVSGRSPAGGAPAAVHAGQRLTIHAIVPGVRVPVEVTRVDPGERWDFVADLAVGRIRSVHVVSDDGGRAAVAVTTTWQGPSAVGGPLLRAYRPVTAWAVRRLVHLAEQAEAGAAANARRTGGR